MANLLRTTIFIKISVAKDILYDALLCFKYCLKWSFGSTPLTQIESNCLDYSLLKRQLLNARTCSL